jgi:hypothetical protein
MKQLLCAFLLGIGLLTLYAPRAEAHGPGYAVVVHEGKVVRKFRRDLPRWLHHHHDFRRWYSHGPHYRRHHPDWHYLYRLYLRDASWHRHHHRHGRYCRH